MSANYIIREATDADYPQILAIYRYCWDEYFKNSIDEYKQVLIYLKEAFDSRQGYFSFWVCDDGKGEIFGWQSCLQVFNSPLRKGYNGEISTYIRHDKQNGILAARLSNVVIKEILDPSPIMVLWTFIDSSNISSQKLASYYDFKISINAIPNSKFYNYNQLWIKTYDKK